MGEIIRFFVLSIAGTLTQSAFLIAFYHLRGDIKHYKTTLFLMLAVMFVMGATIPANPLKQYFIWFAEYVVICAIAKKRLDFGFYLLPLCFVGALSLSAHVLLAGEIVVQFVFVIAILLFMLRAFYVHSEKINIEIAAQTSTKKIFVLLLLAELLAASKFVYSEGV